MSTPLLPAKYIEAFLGKGKDHPVHPFCQIIGKEISPESCIQTQGQPKCFGCAALTRMCEPCRKRGIHVAVAVPAVGLCSSCIISRLALEEESSRGFGHPTQESRVTCLAMKTEIDVKMCRAMQNKDICTNCPAPSRICEQCKQRPCKYPQYGLCLTCSIKTYGEGWKPRESETQSLEYMEEPLMTSLIEEPFAALQDPYESNGNKHRDQAPVDISELCIKCKKRPIKVKLRSLCHSCATRFYTKKTQREMQLKSQRARTAGKTRIRELIPEAREVINKYGKATTTLLTKELHIQFETAAALLALLKKEGVVEQYIKDSSGRLAYRMNVEANSDMESQSFILRNPLSIAEKITGLEELLMTLGEGSRPAHLLRSVLADLQSLEKIEHIIFDSISSK